MKQCFVPCGSSRPNDKIVFDEVAKPWFKMHDAEWREKLKEGDTVDVLYEETNLALWRSGLI